MNSPGGALRRKLFTISSGVGSDMMNFCFKTEWSKKKSQLKTDLENVAIFGVISKNEIKLMA